MRYAAKGLRFQIMTDQPRRYAWFGDRVEVVSVTGERMQAWKGRYNLFSRIKIEYLKELLARQETDLLVLDADLLARQDLTPLVQRIAAGELFMHLIEYPLAKGRSPRTRKVWRHIRGKTYGEVTISDDLLMWNAGVLGFGWQHRAVVERMLAVYDAFSDDGLFKLRHTTQQHTISVCMQRQGPLKPAEQWFAHYWANKGGYQLAIDRQLSVILSRGLSVDEASDYCAAHPIERPLLFRRRWWHKILRKLIPAWA